MEFGVRRSICFLWWKGLSPRGEILAFLLELKALGFCFADRVDLPKNILQHRRDTVPKLKNTVCDDGVSCLV